jgi:predicted ATPase/class 3 adenylate cyclase
LSSGDGERATYFFQGSAIDGSAQAEGASQPGQILLDDSIVNRLGCTITTEPQNGYHRLTHASLDLPQPVHQPPPQADEAIAAHFYPEAILRQVHTGEFRHMVNLFVNLPTVRNEAQLVTFMQTIFELQERNGGLIDKLDFGDKGVNLLLLWGAPVAYENDIERALNFILGLQSSTSIPVSAGLTYHIAHAGFIGSSYLENYTGYGRGINLAARFMTAAPRGEIWVDQEVYHRAEARFEFEALGEHTFKGFSQPQAVYLLVERKVQADAFFRGELIGRQAELARLEAFIHPLCQGRYPGALLITGEAGMGKSRLVHEFIQTCRSRHAEIRWALCQTDEIVREPLNPFRYWLEHFFDQSHVQPEARNKRNFNRLIDDLIEKISSHDRDLADELDRVRSFLGALVGLHWPDSLYEQLDPQGRYENTLIALADLVQALSLLEPLALFIEDIHWLDTVSREFLPRLARTLTSDENRTYPVAILATARPEAGAGHEPWEGLPHERLDLQEISSADLADLASDLLQGAPAPDLVALLQERSEGNPFYVEQIIRYLQEAGQLIQRQGAWSLSAGSQGALLPVDVLSILVARLDRLEQTVRNVVQTAAILGREFEIRILTLMLNEDPALPAYLQRIADAAIWQPLDEWHYIFNHYLMQNTAYQMLLLARRQALHALAVEAMERLFAADLAPHFGELAYHSEKAGLIEKACQYLEQTAELAQKAYQNLQAIQACTRALELTAPGDLAARYRLLLRREGVNFLVGDLDAQKQDLEALSDLALQLDQQHPGGETWAHRAEISARIASNLHQLSEYQRAIDVAQIAIDQAMKAGVPKPAAEAYQIWSMALYRQGDFDQALHNAQLALEFSGRAGVDPSGQSRALNILGLISWDKNDYNSACKYLGQALVLASENNDRRVVAMSLNNLGNLEGSEGDYSTARDHYEEALRIVREIGDQPKEGLLLNNLSWIVGLLGDYPAARAYAQQALRLSRQIGDRSAESYTLINLSALAGREGDNAVALGDGEKALAIALELGDPSMEAWALTCLGHAQAGLGDLEAAGKVYKEALEIRRRLQQPHLACEPLAGLARVALAQGQPAVALGWVEDILAYLEGGSELIGLDEPLRVYLTCYQALKANQEPRAEQVLVAASQLLQLQAARISDTTARRAFLENVPFHRDIQAALIHQA